MITLNIDPDLWFRVCIKATQDHWPTGDAWLYVRCQQYLKGQDSAGGGKRRAVTLGPYRRRQIAKAAGTASAARFTPEEHQARARARAEVRWSRVRAAQAVAAGIPLEEAITQEAARVQARIDTADSAPPTPTATATAYPRVQLWPLAEE